jgi:hypothetical protein
MHLDKHGGIVERADDAAMLVEIARQRFAIECFLRAERCVETRRRDVAHRVAQDRQGRTFIAMLPEQVHRAVERRIPVETTRSSASCHKSSLPIVD